MVGVSVLRSILTPAPAPAPAPAPEVVTSQILPPGESEALVYTSTADTTHYARLAAVCTFAHRYDIRICAQEDWHSQEQLSFDEPAPRSSDPGPAG